MAFCLLSYLIGGLSRFQQSLTASIIVHDASGITEGSEIKMAGVSIGQVESLHLEGTQALRLDPDAQVRNDVIAQIRARSVLGEKYLAILPQSDTATLLQNGEEIRRSQSYMNVDALINIMGELLQEVDPQNVQVLLFSLSKALEENPEALSQMIKDMETTLNNTAKASRHLKSPGMHPKPSPNSGNSCKKETTALIGSTGRPEK